MDNLSNIRRHQEGIIVSFNGFCITTLCHRCINPTGQWALQVQLPVSYKNKDSYTAIVNTNAAGSHDLYVKNLDGNKIEVTNLNGTKDAYLNIVVIGLY